MNDRWKMNRIGFVNFWLYDEEDFEFADGRLLLRGQNGSGKSITTQSFIPFVLDGDRTPSRLDPFGSSDRKMEYYFLGEEGRDEATGYLFLEFKKESAGEYRTIGIGQRARRGKPMDFWGFVILDGRRIGYDLWLYKEVGSSKIPYDKREIRAVLGEENFFTDSQSDYKKHVNQYIFGFRKEEQYEQFIRLLVKVRAPKLSKEFKPTKVYDILNDSLQTLSDEDLRAMVDAMEKMDDIQDSLETLNRAFADVKIIRNEYTRYNQYMLAKKAQAYLTEKEKVENLQREFEERRQKILETKEKRQQGTELLKELQEKERLAETERNGLLDMDLEEIDNKLDYARKQKEEAAHNETRWEDKIQDYKTRIWEQEQELKRLQERLEEKQRELEQQKDELDEQQEILRWEHHEKACGIIENENFEKAEEIIRDLDILKKLVEECHQIIRQYEMLSGQYDEIAGQLEVLKQEKTEKEQAMKQAQTQVQDSIDQWITDVFEIKKNSGQWKPDEEIIHRIEEKVRGYQSVEDAGALQELLRADYEQQRQILLDQKTEKENVQKAIKEQLEKVQEELTTVLEQKELEPERSKETERSRAALAEKGITAVPFYKTVEFSDDLDRSACAQLEAQLQRAGLLDALVIADHDFSDIREKFPEFLDTVIHMEETGNSGFSGLKVNEELSPELKEETSRILSNIYKKENGSGICIGTDGWFRQGILTGRADKSGDAEFIGILARKRRREQRIQELESEIRELNETLTGVESGIREIRSFLETLLNEYRQLPGFGEINAALALEKECEMLLQIKSAEYMQKEKQEQEKLQEKNQKYQQMLQKCKLFPYGRTEAAYEEVGDAIEEYRHIWQEIRQDILQIITLKSNCIDRQDAMERDEQQMDDAFRELEHYSTKRKESELQIRQLEEYLNRPDIAEKANRLKQLREEIREIRDNISSLEKKVAIWADRMERMQEEEPEKKQELQREIAAEQTLRNYFEEELALKLVLEREGRTLYDCAKAAAGFLRENDRNREQSEVFQALFRVYQQHNGSLIPYGTSIENCFGSDQNTLEENGTALRSRVRIVSTWQGKQVYLEEFYNILKTAIEETELLIKEKDRELFEDILSQTISQQLTDKIAESRKWVADMSSLMNEMDTSMGLSFSLEWKPCKPENDTELEVGELEKILLRDHALLTMEDIEKVAAHFRSRIQAEKAKLEENNGTVTYIDLVRDALDYRKWFEFRMFYKRGEGSKKPLTNAAFNRFSGGEKAMAMYVPLFAAVNAQYQKAENKDHPRMVALDEAFAGVDDKNISSMFELVQKLDFDYIMNSQSLWGCFETVRGLRIAELQRPQDSQVVSVIFYTWNGSERILDEQ